MQSIIDDYIECALWSITDDNGEPLDLYKDELADETLAKMQADCDKFYSENKDACDFWESEGNSIGHDLWLTRNHHGAGFWDRGTKGSIIDIIGEYLTKKAHAMGECNLYIGDDGKIYIL